MSVGRRNEDGSFEEAQPLGWQGHTLDFEVYPPGQSDPVQWIAMGFDEDMLISVIATKTRIGLLWKIYRAGRKHQMKVTILDAG